MIKKYGYALLEVGGIQQFILGTGKLKEMIGGSELIDEISSKDPDKSILNIILERMKLRIVQAEEIGEGTDWVLPVQRNAGTVHLILSSKEKAVSFVRTFCEYVLEKYPGLPLFATSVECEWTLEGYREARKNAAGNIAKLRSEAPVPTGMPMLPFCIPSKIDGFPAAEYSMNEPDGKKEPISLVSKTRRKKELISSARERLHELSQGIDLSVSAEWHWPEDLAEMIGKERVRVALVHIDGNDLGKLFQNELAAMADKSNLSLEERIKNMTALSELVDRSNKEAFRSALRTILHFEATEKNIEKEKAFIIPIRPLVLGGDDITVIVRADLALAFVNAYAKRFEAYSKENGKHLSVGIGMVVMPAGYPFTKAFSYVEELLKSAKRMTKDMADRPSSLDWLTITNDMEPSLDAVREHICTAKDNSLLTAKPYLIQGSTFSDFILEGFEVLHTLPRSSMRGVLKECRKGEADSRESYEKQKENLGRSLGGRHGSTLMSLKRFEELFPKGYFSKVICQKKACPLPDYLELEKLLPSQEEAKIRNLFEEK